MVKQKTLDCFKCVASLYVKNSMCPQGLSDKQPHLHARLLKRKLCRSLSSTHPLGWVLQERGLLTAFRECLVLLLMALLGRGVPSTVRAALLTPQRSPMRDLGDLNVFALFVGKWRWGIKMSGTRRCEDCRRSGGRAAEQHCCGRAGGCFNFFQGPFADRYRMWMQMFFQLMTFGDECTSSRFYPEGMLLRALICYAK